MNEIEKAVRKNVFDSLFLISSKDEQLKYQKNVPIADVPAEIFCSWDGSFSLDDEIILKVFDQDELNILSEFNNIFELICDKTPENLPSIEEFVISSEWKELSSAAKDALDKLEGLKK